MQIKNMNVKELSQLQERQVANAIVGAKVTPASGGTKFGGGDVETKNILIECKTTTKPKDSFSIKKEGLEKIDEQAFEQGKEVGALAFRFEPDGEDYLIVNRLDFSYLSGLFDQEKDREEREK